MGHYGGVVMTSEERSSLLRHSGPLFSHRGQIRINRAQQKYQQYGFPSLNLGKSKKVHQNIFHKIGVSFLLIVSHNTCEIGNTPKSGRYKERYVKD